MDNNGYEKQRLMAIYNQLNSDYKNTLLAMAEFYLERQNKESGSGQIVDITNKLNRQA